MFHYNYADPTSKQHIRLHEQHDIRYGAVEVLLKLSSIKKKCIIILCHRHDDDPSRHNIIIYIVPAWILNELLCLSIKKNQFARPRWVLLLRRALLIIMLNKKEIYHNNMPSPWWWSINHCVSQKIKEPMIRHVHSSPLYLLSPRVFWNVCFTTVQQRRYSTTHQHQSNIMTTATSWHKVIIKY